MGFYYKFSDQRIVHGDVGFKNKKWCCQETKSVFSTGKKTSIEYETGTERSGELSSSRSTVKMVSLVRSL